MWGDIPSMDLKDGKRRQNLWAGGKKNKKNTHTLRGLGVGVHIGTVAVFQAPWSKSIFFRPIFGWRL